MDTTSQKQLEDAARAAGYTPVGLTDDGTALLLEGIQQAWNPRDENPHSDCMGDALRLAVKLQLTVCNEHASAGVAYCTSSDGTPEFPEAPSMADTGDKITDADYAATRRAIVLAAAQIGASLPT
jgi:hypothetical protein